MGTTWKSSGNVVVRAENKIIQNLKIITRWK
jgi:hypothetical protein